MTSPLYFVIDTLDLTSPPYSLMAFSAPAPQLEAETAAALEYQPDNSAWSRDQHDASVITATVKISGVSEADALAAVNAIVKSAHSDAIAYAQQSAQTDTLSKLIYHADVQGPFDYDVAKIMLQSKGYISALVTLTCYPYWVAPEVVIEEAYIIGQPGTATISGVAGEVPALTLLKVMSGHASSAIALGIRSNPDDVASFVSGAVQDYPVSVGTPTADSRAKGGNVWRQAATTSWGIGTEGGIMTAPPLDVRAMAGRFVAWVRGCWGIATSTNVVRGASDVTGSGISAMTTVPSTAVVPASSTLLDTVCLGEVSVPASDVPTTTTAGYGVLTITDSHTTEAYGALLNSDTPIGTVTLLGGSASIALECHASPSPGLMRVSLYAGPSPVGHWYIPVQPSSSYAYLGTSNFKVGAGTYTLMACSIGTPCYIHTNVGETVGNYQLYQQAPLGFYAHTPVQIKTSTTGYYSIDYTTLIPCDECYFAANYAFSAWQGVLIDESAMRDDSTNAYLCDTGGGVGPSLIGSIDPRYPFLLRPGTNVIVALAAVPGDSDPGDLAISGSYWPRYLSLSKGD